MLVIVWVYVNISSILDLTATTGVTAFRPINLIDTSALIKLARVDDSNGAGFDLQQWDSTVTTMTSRSLVTAEEGNLTLNNRIDDGKIIFKGKTASGTLTAGTFAPGTGLGIGTDTPETSLHMEGEGANTSQVLMRQYADNVDGPDIRFPIIPWNCCFPCC